MDEIRLQTLRKLIAQAGWVKSKTYKPPYDHEYVVYQNEPELCDLLKQAISEDGFDRSFHGHMHRYLVIDGYRYWHYQVIYNRDLASKEFPE